MTQSSDDKLLTELYKAGENNAPPAHLDAAILNQAKSDQRRKATGQSWRPWLAAASVVLVIPMIWLLSQQDQLIETATQSLPSSTTEPVDSVAKNKASAAEQGTMDDSFADAIPEAEADRQWKAPSAAVSLEQRNSTPKSVAIKDLEEQLQATPEPSSAPAEALQDSDTLISITGNRISRAAVEAKKEQLKAELQAPKKTIKASTMDPLMALEYAQFNRYLEQQQFDQADQLLTDLQERYPDFDYEDMIYQLAIAEAKAESEPQQ